MLELKSVIKVFKKVYFNLTCFLVGICSTLLNTGVIVMSKMAWAMLSTCFKKSHMLVLRPRCSACKEVKLTIVKYPNWFHCTYVRRCQRKVCVPNKLKAQHSTNIVQLHIPYQQTYHSL